MYGLPNRPIGAQRNRWRYRDLYLIGLCFVWYVSPFMFALYTNHNIMFFHQTRYTPHRRPWRFGHFLQLALTFVHQHFLQGTSAYLRFVPFFSMFQETLQCSEELSWWHGSLVLSPSPLKHEFRNYWRKNSVTVLLLCGIDMSREPFKL